MSLSIKKIILYKHGVGYFERVGEVEGSATIDLHFRRQEMNDVLKSLTTIDLDGGIIGSISYESYESVEHKLKDIAIRLADDGSLSHLIAQIKGAMVGINIAAGEIIGKVVGMDTNQRIVDGNIMNMQYLVLLVDAKEFHRYDLMEIKKIELLDEALRDELQHLLDVLFSANKKDMKQLSIFTKGQGKRRILTSYVVECPVWKTSYRILLDDDKPLIQGWAIVDNTMDEDWNDIDLTLVAGLPISFVHDLYTSRYKRRPVVEIEEEEAYAPPLLEGGHRAEMEDVLPDEWDDDDSVLKSAFAAAAPMQMEKQLSQSRSRGVDIKQNLEQSIQVHTHTAEVSDLFQYDITHPINVKRGQSALVPIVQTAFEGRRVAIYNRNVRDRNPMSAVLIKNTTGMTLEGGPLTVLEDDVYVGEAMLETMRPDEEKIIPFSVELGCVIRLDHKSRSEEFHSCTAQHGYLYLYRYELNTTVYIIDNKTRKNIDLFLDHPFIHNWELTSEPKPVEETDNFYRFRFDVMAGKSMKFEVVEKGETSETYYLDSVDNEQIAYWLRQNYITDETREQLQTIIAIKTRITNVEQLIQHDESERQDIFENQERVRDNLHSLGDGSDEKSLRERYIQRLNQDEDKLLEIKQSLAKLNEELTALRQQLRSEIEEIHFSRSLKKHK